MSPVIAGPVMKERTRLSLVETLEVCRVWLILFAKKLLMFREPSTKEFFFLLLRSPANPVRKGHAVSRP